MPDAFVVNAVSNAFSSAPGGMPGPPSRTRTTVPPASLSAETWTEPRPPIASAAFVIRLTRTMRSMPGSQYSSASGSGPLTRTADGRRADEAASASRRESMMRPRTGCLLRTRSAISSMRLRSRRRDARSYLRFIARMAPISAMAATFVPTTYMSPVSVPYTIHRTAPARIVRSRYFETSRRRFVLYPWNIWCAHPDSMSMPASTPTSVRAAASSATGRAPAARLICRLRGRRRGARRAARGA